MKFSITTITKIAALVGMLGATGIMAPGNAQAGNIGVEFLVGNGIEIYYNGNTKHRGHSYRHRRNQRSGYYDPYYQPKYNRRHKRRNNNYHHQPRRQVCGPRRAVNKAYRLGLNNPQVHRIRDRRIVVTGYQYGYRTKMVFKRHSNCRLLKTVNFTW